MLVFRDYEILVVQEYRRKRAAGALPLALIEPTPARLRDECLTVCKERYNRKDEPTLRDFFGEGDSQVGWLRVIDRWDIDKFRPLVNFLKNKTDTTDDKNIELLAWLIDYQPRPFIFREYVFPVKNAIRRDEPPKEYIEEEPKAAAEPPIKVQENEPPEPTSPVEIGRKTKIIIVAVAIILVAIGVGVYWSKADKPGKYLLSGHEACMFWDDDHYQPIPCQQHGDTLVVALDSDRLVHFRKITKPDTITINAIGAVWYVRYRKSYEFYTADGFHPIDPQLRLRPITEFIIKNHIHPEQ